MSKVPNISTIVNNLEISRQELLEAQSQLSILLQQYDMIIKYNAPLDPNSNRPTKQHFDNDILMLKENIELFRQKMDSIQNQLNTITKKGTIPLITHRTPSMTRSRSRSRSPSPHKGSPRGGKNTKRKYKRKYKIK
jgi:hypothetical protein